MIDASYELVVAKGANPSLHQHRLTCGLSEEECFDLGPLHILVKPGSKKRDFERHLQVLARAKENRNLPAQSNTSSL